MNLRNGCRNDWSMDDGGCLNYVAATAQRRRGSGCPIVTATRLCARHCACAHFGVPNRRRYSMQMSRAFEKVCFGAQSRNGAARRRHFPLQLVLCRHCPMCPTEQNEHWEICRIAIFCAQELTMKN